ncbi:MAG: 2-oxo acid dehydrogenase subunit E2 [Candidatus Latescibacteria bacterium]|jgi:pyruvate dehydrogenase E2 component (dihydrolipoamide acetyltransferase)|nr:2-oxo acid dehydrogenase subunit E2 [Candidatus Latescibacterota bacterium]
MPKPIIMPQVGQDIESAVILEWRVKENDPVKKGDIIFVVESDKAVFEVESDESGVILKILYCEGEEANVLEPVAYIGKSGENVQDSEEFDTAVTQKTEKISSDNAQTIKQADSIKQSKVFASPSAHRVARENDIDLTTLHGSGPNGRIVKKDVLAATVFAESASEIKSQAYKEKFSIVSEMESVLPEDTVIHFSKIRRRIAERLTQSKQTIPHFYLSVDVDMTPALEARRAYNYKAQKRISINDIIIKETASTLYGFRNLNAHVADNRLVIRKNINIGIAVSTDDGLVVPVISDADQKDIQEISRLSQEIIKNARKGNVKSRNMGTFTISNLSMYLIDKVLPIINPPECAILGVGGIKKRVVPIDSDSNIGIRDMVTLTLACDHRAVDGVYAAKFLNRIKKNIEIFTLLP